MSKVDDLDPGMVLAAAAATEREARMVELRRLELAVQWCVLHPATTETGVATHNPDTTLPGVLGHGRVVGRRRDAGGGGVHPRTVRRGHADVSRRRCPAVGRRPRPDPPPPPPVVPGPGAHDPGVAGPPGRPTHPPTRPWPRRGGSTNGSPTAPAAARSSWTGWSPTRSRSSTPRNTRAARTKARRPGTSNSFHPGPTEFTGTQRAARPRRHPGPDQVLRPGLRHRPPAPHPRRPRRARRPQSQSARRTRRPRSRPGRPRPRRPRPDTPRRRRSASPCHVNAHDLRPTRASGDVRAARPRHGRQDQGMGRPRPGHHPTRPRPRARRRRRPARPTGLDAGDRHPPRPALRVPRLPGRRPLLRPGPPRPLPRPRRRRPTRPNQPSEPRLPLQTPPPSQDRRPLAIPPRPRPGSYLWHGPRRGVPRHPHRHDHPAHAIDESTILGPASGLRPPESVARASQVGRKSGRGRVLGYAVPGRTHPSRGV